MYFLLLTLLGFAAATPVTKISENSPPLPEVRSGYFATRAASSGIGSLFCTPTSLQYVVLDSEIFAKVFVDPSQTGGALVHSVKPVGSSQQECSGLKVTGGQGPYHAVNIPYGECNVMWGSNGLQFEYSNTFLIEVRIPTRPGSTSYRSYKLQQPVRCVGDMTAQFSEPEISYVGHVETLEEGVGHFSIPVKAISRDEVLSGYKGVLLPTQVITMTFELYENDTNIYELFVDQCWGTTDGKSDSKPRYQFLDSQGCLKEENADFVANTPGIIHQVQVASYLFENNEDAKMYVHCVVNFCRKSGSKQRCQERCEGRSAAAFKADQEEPEPSKKLLISEPIEVRRDDKVQPRFKIMEDGKVHRV